MGLFNKKKTTEEKFKSDKKRKIISSIIRMYRDDKFKLPQTEISARLIELCNKIDPDKTMSQEKLIDIIQDSDIVKEFNDTLENDAFLFPDYVIKDYAEKYYASMFAAMTSPDSQAWDKHEFQSQQLVSVLSSINFDRFRTHLENAMDKDPKCPWVMKHRFMDLLHFNEPRKSPTPDEENIAEKIMRMVCSNLEETNPTVFRALVDSLKWRGSEELIKTLAAVEKTPPEKRKLKGRESCVFIESEDTVHYVG